MQPKRPNHSYACLLAFLLAGCIHHDPAPPVDPMGGENVSPAQIEPMPSTPPPNYFDDDDEPEVLSI